MDTLLHVAGFVANMQAGANDAFICSQVDSVKVVPGLIDNDATYDVFCRNAWLPEEGLILADAYAVTTGNSSKIVAHLKRMHFRKVRLPSLKRALKHAQGGSTSYTQTRAPAKSVAPAPVAVKTSAPPAPSKSDHRSVLDQVRKAVADTCDVPVSSMDVSADLTSFGVDSLMSIEVFGRLQALFPSADLDPRVLSHLHTISEIAAEVASKAGDIAPVTVPETQSTPAPAPINTGNVVDLVRQAVADTCDVPVSSMDISADLTSFGVDSLMSIEIFSRLQALFPGVDLDPRVLSHLHTISEIAAEVGSKASNGGGIPPAVTPASSGTVVEEGAVGDGMVLEDQGTDVKTVVAGVLGIGSDEFNDDTDLESLGLDSLTSIEVMQAVHDMLSISLPHNYWPRIRHVRAISDFVFSQRKPVKGSGGVHGHLYAQVMTAV
ncbi:hypothetical protein MPER_09541 [Moniliophthora perniciosa FA553]|nr:hypothetical protein MPER_09541 [Moniliophthora perniciosa FA553]